MGGNAIKKVPVKRIPKDTYKKIIQTIIDILTPLDIRFTFPYETPGKESFGDIDVLVDNTVGIGRSKEDVYRFLQETFHTPEIVSSGYVVSFAYKNEEDYHQVDFILVSNIEMAQLYFSYGDCGAIIGRYTYSHGLTFSESGLLVKVKACYLPSKRHLPNDNIVDTIVLSSNPIEVCEYLGLNYERWKEGFSVIEEIFEWITTSRFFQREIFFFLKMDHRKRAQLRPFYNQFLQFINIDSETVDNLEKKFVNENILQNVLDGIETFHRMKEFLAIEEKYLKDEERKLKFNSKVFMNYGIHQYQLAEVMKSFKFSKNTEKDTFEEWIDRHNEEEINKEIFEWIQNLPIENLLSKKETEI